jgi:hypothetical protein
MKTNTSKTKKEIMKEKFDKIMKFNKSNLELSNFHILTDYHYQHKIEPKYLIDSLKGFKKENFEEFWTFITTHKVLITQNESMV